jgi:lysophospholipase L1-like esterase
VNLGIPGETASQGEGRLPGVLNTRRPQVLMLLEGINDMNSGVTPVRAASSVANMVNMARLYNLTVLVATMPQTYESISPTGVIRENSHDQIVAFNNEIKRLVAGLQNVHVVDLYAAFGSNRSFMGGDGLHPTESGYQRMAQEFELRIEQIFPVRGGVQ